MGDLLKEAIADAKAVRETALANAKAALEEAFTPKLQSMLSQKLKEEDLEEGEHEDDEEDSDEGMREEDDEAEEGRHDADEGEHEEGRGDADEGEHEEGHVDGHDDEDDSADDKDLDLDVGDDDDDDDDSEEEGDLDLEAIIRELEDEDEEVEEVYEEEELEEVDKSSGIGSGTGRGDTDKASGIGSGDNKLSEEEDKDEEEAEETVDEEIVDLSELLNDLTEEEDSDEEVEEVKAENVKLSNSLKEHRKVVKYLKDKLNEVNLLNAKLLYTNKLFKGYNLSNDQKLKIVETFDRAKNSREVKLVYSTLAESFAGKTGSAVTKINESKSIASKSTGSTKPKKVISEGNELADRFKKLAGII